MENRIGFGCFQHAVSVIVCLFVSFTLPATNSSQLKMACWNASSLWDGLFSGAMHVSFRGWILLFSSFILSLHGVCIYRMDGWMDEWMEEYSVDINAAFICILHAWNAMLHIFWPSFVVLYGIVEAGNFCMCMYLSVGLCLYPPQN